MESVVRGKVMGGTKCASASGCEDGDGMSSANPPVLGNKAARRESKVSLCPAWLRHSREHWEAECLVSTSYTFSRRTEH